MIVSARTDMNPGHDAFYVGAWRVEPSLRTVTGAEVSTRLEPKVYEVLCCLAESAGEVVSKEQLIERVWAGTFVTDDVLVRAVSELRHLFKDDIRQPQYIQTVPKGGYRLIARVNRDSAPPAIRSLVVLPFASLSGDAEKHVANGMSDALIDELVKLNALERVIGPVSAMRYDQPTKSLRDIAAELRVDALIAGAVERSGSCVRIAVRLVDGRHEGIRWSETYHRNLGNLSGLYREVVRAIAREVRLALAPAEEARLTATATRTDPEAYELYLRGRAASRGLDIGGAVAAYERAVERDDTFAAAWGELALALVHRSYFGPGRSTLPRARAAAERALALAPDITAARIALARIRLHADWDWDGTDSELQKALVLEPRSADVRWQYGFYLLIMGRHDEALREARTSLELEPLSPFAHFQMAFMQRSTGRSHEAVEEMERALALQPGSSFLRYQLAMTRVLAGQYEQARLDFDRSLHDTSSSVPARESDAYLAYLLALSDDESRARSIARELEHEYKQGLNGGLYTTAFAIACVYAGLGDHDRAFAWLQQSFTEREFILAQLPADPFFQPLRHDRRYDALLSRMGYPE